MLRAKKVRELRYVSAFLEVSGFTDWRIRVNDDESPDVVVDTPDGVLGIEVTTLNKGESKNGSIAMAGESTRRRFLTEVASEYYRMGGKPVRLQVVCPLRSTPRIVGADAIHRLASTLRSRRARMRSEWSRSRFTMSGSELTIFMRALPDSFGKYIRWQWVSDAVGWVRDVDASTIAACVQKKAAKLSRYQLKVHRVLLLIVADRTRASGMFTVPETLAVDSYGFDEVHVFEYPISSRRLA